MAGRSRRSRRCSAGHRRRASAGRVGRRSWAALIPALLPGLVAAAIGYVIFVGLGDWGGLDVGRARRARPARVRVNARADLVIAVLVGIVTAVVIARRPASATAALDGQRRVGMRGAAARRRARGRPAGPAHRKRWAGTAQETLFSGQSAVPDARRRRLGGDRPARARDEGAGLRHLPRLRLPRRPGVPGHLRRRRRRDAPGDRVRRSRRRSPWRSAPARAWPPGRGCCSRRCCSPRCSSAAPGLDAVPATVLAIAAAWLTVAALDNVTSRSAAPQ